MKLDDEISPTLGFDIKTVFKDGFKLCIWDIGGQETIRAYWRNYFSETNGILFVIDSSDKRRLLDCKKELENILTKEKLFGASLLILANKQDLTGALTAAQISEILELESNPIYKKREYKIVSCTATTGVGIDAGFDWIVQSVSSKLFILN